MKIALFNDTHLGLTHYNHLLKAMESLKLDNPDMIVHAGDFCGGTHGHKAVRSTINIIREHFPQIPIVVVIGNHDLWVPKLTMNHFLLNYVEIKDIFKRNNIHFLDENGPFRLNGVCITGASGWYATKPTSNDWKYIPETIHGDSQSYFQKKKSEILEKNLQFTEEDKIRIYLSHFPVINCNPWDDRPTGEQLMELHNINYFFSGHSHTELNGPVHYRTAIDYKSISYKIIEV